MRNWLTTVALLTLLGSRSTIAQTKGSAGSAAATFANQIASSSHAPDATRLIGGTPVGHRQPHAKDVPADEFGGIDTRSEILRIIGQVSHTSKQDGLRRGDTMTVPQRRGVGGRSVTSA
jgi:hypothetical protein